MEVEPLLPERIMSESTESRACRRPAGSSRPGVIARLVGVALVPIVAMGVLATIAIRSDLAARAEAVALRGEVQRLERLVDLRAALFVERIAYEVLRPEFRPPDDVLADSDLGALLLADPDAPARAVDRSLARLATVDRPIEASDLSLLRAARTRPVTPESVPELYDTASLRIDDAVRSGFLDVRERAVGLEEVELIRAGDDVVEAIRAPAVGGMVLESLSALWVAEPAERPAAQSAVADAMSQLARVDEEIDRAGSGALRAQWSGPLTMPPALRSWLELAVAGGLTSPQRPPGEPADVGFALLEGLDWVVSLDALPSLAVGELSVRADEAAAVASSTVRHTVTVFGLVVLGSIAAGAVFGRSIVRPVRRLTDHAQRVGEGQLDLEPLRFEGPPEVARAARAFNDVVDNLVLLERKANALAECDFDDPALEQVLPGRLGASLQESVRVLSGSIVDREQLQRRLAHEATHDPLTGLANRAALVDLIGRSLCSPATEDGHRGQVAVVFIDLDGFKQINDRLGHAAGDEVLRVVASRLGGLAAAGQLVGRLGGDEFLAVLPSVEDPTEPLHFSRRVVRAFSEPVSVAETVVEMGASAGVAMSPHRGDHSGDPLDLLRRADLAVYRAKQTRADVVLYDDEFDRELARVEDVEEALSQALQRPVGDELVLLYQPIVDTATGCLRGVETLLRWDRPGHGRVPPDAFIPVAERSGLVRELDLWVLARAAQQLRDWSDTEGLEDVLVSVNVSGRSLLDPDFVGRFAGVLRVSGLEPSRLTVEVTETVLVTDLELVAGRLSALRDLGVRVSIDDFGTGYTSVAHLRTLPLDEIKIDGGFVRRLPDAEHRVLVQMMTQLAHHLGVPTVAEGVETAEQLDAVMAIGCDSLQGYLFSPPLTSGELPGWVSCRIGRRSPEDATAPTRPIASGR